MISLFMLCEDLVFRKDLFQNAQTECPDAGVAGLWNMFLCERRIALTSLGRSPYKRD